MYHLEADARVGLTLYAKASTAADAPMAAVFYQRSVADLGALPVAPALVVYVMSDVEYRRVAATASPGAARLHVPLDASATRNVSEARHLVRMMAGVLDWVYVRRRSLREGTGSAPCPAIAVALLCHVGWERSPVALLTLYLILLFEHYRGDAGAAAPGWERARTRFVAELERDDVRACIAPTLHSAVQDLWFVYTGGQLDFPRSPRKRK